MTSPRGLIAHALAYLKQLRAAVGDLAVTRRDWILHVRFWIWDRDLEQGLREALAKLSDEDLEGIEAGEPPLSKPYPSNALQCSLCRGGGRNGACKQCKGRGWVRSPRQARRCRTCRRVMLPHQTDCENCPGRPERRSRK